MRIAVRLLMPTRKTNFSHNAVRMSVVRSTSNSAPWQAARKRSARALRVPSSSPKIIRCMVPVWRITPGSAIAALIWATPPITAPEPRIGTSRSAASMPFCSGMTAVSAPISGLIAWPAVSTSHSLTQNSTMSTVPMVDGSSVAWVGTM